MFSHLHEILIGGKRVHGSNKQVFMKTKKAGNGRQILSLTCTPLLLAVLEVISENAAAESENERRIFQPSLKDAKAGSGGAAHTYELMLPIYANVCQ